MFLYKLSILFYQFMVTVLSPFHDKARKFRRGRQGWYTELTRRLGGRTEKRVWIHAASLGEFEQGRPVIEALKRARPEIKILLTFFSPSGYEVRKNYPLAEYVFYLPVDSPHNARRFVRLVNPELALFVKYEFWYYYMKELMDQSIPLLLISGIFRKDQFFFRPSGRFFHPVLIGIHHFFVQDQRSGDLLEGIGITHYTVAGDTRYDRVLTIASEKKELPIAIRFAKGEKVMVLGSTWPADMDHLRPVIREFSDQMKFIIAPHNIGEEEIEALMKLPASIRYSQATEETVGKARVLVIDNIGMLSSLYGYGDFAFVGGGFRGGLHNVLEAAVYGIPVFFGSHKKNVKFIEAKGLVAAGGAFEVSSGLKIIETMKRLRAEKDFHENTCDSARLFVENNSGATQKIMAKILQLI